jgi:CBS domain-containing protein
MYVSDQMTRDVFAVASDTSLETASRLLTTNGISGAPVISASGVPIGVISLTDLADPDRQPSRQAGYPLFYVLHGSTIEEVGDSVAVGEGRVEDVMSTAVLSIDSSATLKAAGLQLVECGVHRLLVIDEDKLVGVISSLDVLRGVLR